MGAEPSLLLLFIDVILEKSFFKYRKTAYQKKQVNGINFIFALFNNVICVGINHVLRDLDLLLRRRIDPSLVGLLPV
jgi:hypothetical protein